MRPRHRYPLHVLLATLFLVVRLADAHAHLCFDGKEPPTTVHFADGDAHPCETGGESGHSGDKDVQLTPDVVLKKASGFDAWLPASPIYSSSFAAAALSEPLRTEPPVRAASAPDHFLPPLRGPPV